METRRKVITKRGKNQRFLPLFVYFDDILIALKKQLKNAVHVEKYVDNVENLYLISFFD